VKACGSVLLVAVLAGCVSSPTRQHYTAGVFLEPRVRAAIPDGIEVRRISEKGLDLTKREEGFRRRPYNDIAGYCTVAYGHLIWKRACDGTEPAEFLAGVSKARGGEILDADMLFTRWTVQRLTKVKLTEGQFAALCDFTFNVGTGNFSQSTLLKVVNAGTFDRVPSQLARWTKAGGKEVAALARRRQREIDLFFEGLPRPRGARPAGEDLSPIDIRTGESGTATTARLVSPREGNREIAALREVEERRLLE
jgi:lysozyme